MALFVQLLRKPDHVAVTMDAPQNQFLVDYKCYVCVCVCVCGALFVQFLQKPDHVVAAVDVLFVYCKKISGFYFEIVAVTVGAPQNQIAPKNKTADAPASLL